MKDRPILVMLGGAVLVTVGLMALRFGAAQLACNDCDESELLPLSISDDELGTTDPGGDVVTSLERDIGETE